MARSARANRIAAHPAPVIAELQAAGVTSLNGIAEALNARGVLTPAGSDHWYASQVARLLKRLAGQARWAPNMRRAIPPARRRPRACLLGLEGRGVEAAERALPVGARAATGSMVRHREWDWNLARLGFKPNATDTGAVF
jgi:hypothetical protein